MIIMLCNPVPGTKEAAVFCEAMAGGSWTVRHDKTKLELMRLLNWSAR